MKAIILARVSSEEQRDNDSIPAQTRRLTEYCVKQNLSILETYQLVESSTTANRKKFKEILHRIKVSKETLALVTDTVDRLQRDFKESVELEELRKKGKIELHFLRENLIINQKSNSADRLRWDMAVMVAKSYVTQLSDNVKRSQEERRLHGEWSAKAPFGYANTRRGNKAWVEPDENAVVVQQIYQKYATGGFSIRSLAVWLRNTYSLTLSSSQIQKILSNPFYCGEMISNGKTYPHIYQTIISRELFESAQSISKKRFKRSETPFKYGGIPYLYRGLIVCGDCGCRITPEQSKGYHYYHCTGYKGKHANLKWVREEELTRQFMEAIRRIQPSEAQFQELMRLLKETYDTDGKTQKEIRAILKSKITMNETKSGKLLDIYLESGLTQDEYKAKKDELEREHKTLICQLESLESISTDWYNNAVEVLTLLKQAPELFSESSELDEKRQIINFLFRNLTLTNGKLGYELKNPFAKMDFSEHCSDWLPGLDSNQ